MILIYFLVIPLLLFFDNKYFDTKYSDFINTIFSVLSFIFVFVNTSFGIHLLNSSLFNILIVVAYFFLKGVINIYILIKQGQPLSFKPLEYLGAGLFLINSLEVKVVLLCSLLIPKLVNKVKDFVEVDKTVLVTIITLFAIVSNLTFSYYAAISGSLYLTYYLFSSNFNRTYFFRIIILISISVSFGIIDDIYGYLFLVLPFAKFFIFSKYITVKHDFLQFYPLNRISANYKVRERLYWVLPTNSNFIGKDISERTDIVVRDENYSNIFIEPLAILILFSSLVLLGVEYGF